MKKLIYTAMVVVLGNIVGSANTIGVCTTNIGKIHFGWASDGSEEEFRETVIAYLCNLYLQKNYKSNYKSLPEIHLSTSYSFFDKFSIRYDKEEVFVSISSNKDLTQKSLKAMDVVIENLDYFQRAYKFYTKQHSEYYTIEVDEATIMSGMHKELNETQLRLLNTEYYRNIYSQKVKTNCARIDILYSFKNDTFFFHKLDGTMEKLDKVRYALTYNRYGSLIFDTDSSFYYNVV